MDSPRPRQWIPVVVMASVAILAIAIKLFTYEFYLSDDPTCGLALRAVPVPVPVPESSQ